MNRAAIRGVTTGLLAGVLGAGLCGCQALKKSSGEDGARGATAEATAPPDGAAQPEAAATPGGPGAPDSSTSPSPAGPAAAAAPAPTPSSPSAPASAAATAPSGPEATRAPATAPPVEEAGRSEFAGLPKGEAEFILACRRAGEGSREAVAGKGGLLFSRAELHELGANRLANSVRHRMIVGTLAAYAARVRAAGAEFVFVPVPPKAVVHPDYLPGEPALPKKRFDSYLRGLYSDLRRSGIRVVDVSEELIRERFSRRGVMYPAGESHWTPRAAEVAAGQLRKEVRRADPLKGLERDKSIVAREVTLTIQGASFPARAVASKSASGIAPLPEPANGGAPIVLVGDRNAAVYHGGRGGATSGRAGLADQLAIEFGAPVEVRSDPTLHWTQAPSKFAPGSAPAVKLVVWAIEASDLLEESAARESRPAAAPVAARAPAARPSRRAGPRDSGTRPRSEAPGLRLREPALEMRTE